METSSDVVLDRAVGRLRIDKNLLLLFFVRIASSMGIAVLFSSLTLYFTTAAGINEKLAAEIMGVFLALNYVLPLLSGYVGNNFINFKKLYCFGMATQGVGFIVLALASLKFMYISLSLLLIGSMVGSVGIIMFVSEITGTDEIYRRRAMLWNYCAMNIGVFAGCIAGGFFGLHNAYRTLFLLISALPLLAAFLVGYFFKYKAKPKREISHTTGTIILSILVLTILLTYVLQYATSLRLYILLASLSAAAYLIYAAFSFEKKNRMPLISFVYYLVIGVLFWSAYLLTPTVVMLFIKDHVFMSLYHIAIAPQWLNNIDPTLLIIGTPLLALFVKKVKETRNFDIPTSVFFSIGILFAAIALLFLSYIIAHELGGMKIPFLYATAYLGLMSVGELFIGPEGFSLPGKFVPETLRGVATGAWLSTMGVASVLASFISDRILSSNNVASTATYGFVFHRLAVGLLLVAAFTLVFGFWLDKRGKLIST